MALGLLLLPPVTQVARAAGEVLPANFQDSVAFSGLTHPTAVRFASDGRVFVAEKHGLIKVFSSITATTATVFADLSREVDDYWDRGLTGMTLDPQFPAQPYVYALYAYDAPIGGAPPTWGGACPSPPGPTTDGCVISGRLVRLTASSANPSTSVAEKQLINDWCQQFPSHSVDDLHFGPDGALYVSAGEGSDFNKADYGQSGGTNPPDKANPCGDPSVGAGGAQTPPTAEGGALRSQSTRRPAAEPRVLGGAVLRVDPATGAGFPGNPFIASGDANAQRIIAYGLRNPFRFTFRPGTADIWLGNVGWNTWEDLDHITVPGTVAAVQNYGWPCYEGGIPQPGYQALGLNLCNSLYNTANAVTPPAYTYNHSNHVVAGDACPVGGSSITGTAFYTGGSYPASYNGSLFFADHTRNCIYAMGLTNGQPDPAKLSSFVTAAANPIDLETGPGGDIFYVDHEGGLIHRIRYLSPTATFTASPPTGPAPLTVAFDGTASSDPHVGGSITGYSWDLNGDGATDSTAARPTFTYPAPGTYKVSLQVTDSEGQTATSSQSVSVAKGPPAPTIDTPAASLTWRTGDLISFSGHATDPQDGTLAPSALNWTLILHHCFSPTNCHTHLLQTFPGVASSSVAAPDHGYPSYLEIQLQATDSAGLSTSTNVRLDPKTVDLRFTASTPGLQIGVDANSTATPFTTTVIVNSTHSVSAASPQVLGGSGYTFSAWSDGGAESRTLTAPAGTATYAATFVVWRVYQLTQSAYGNIGALGVSDPGPAAWPGWAIARDTDNTTNGGYMLDGFGGLHPLNGAPAATGSPYWPSWDVARAVAVRPDGQSGYVLDAFGGIHPFGGAPAVIATGYWAGWDIARDIVLRPDGVSGYVLDGFGGVHGFGTAGSQPPALNPTAYWGGWDIAHRLTLNSGGDGGYVLDGFGGLHPFGRQAAAVATTGYWPGWDIARDVSFLPGSDTQGYVLDGFGSVHPFGGAANAATPVTPGQDVWRAIVLSSPPP